jgi:DNA polymerase-3 subunit delta
MLESLKPLLAARTFPPVLLLFGEEEFLVEEATNALTAAAVDSSDPMSSFNFDIFDGGDITPESLVEMCSAFPMMSARRVVVVKHFEKMTLKRTKDAEKKSPLTAYFTKPAPTTFLLLVADASELAGLKAALSNPKQQDKAKKKLAALKFPYNVLVQHGEWMEFPKLYERELPSWVATRFKSLGREIAPDACELLVAQSGESLRDLHNEIQKILTYVQDKRSIVREDIASVIGASKTANVFELQKAVGLRHISESIEIMRRMLAVDRQELLIISMLTRYFTALWKLTEAIRITRNQFELAKSVGISAFFVPEYLAALEHYPQHRIERSFLALCDADMAIKTSAESADIALQKMLIAIIDE